MDRHTAEDFPSWTLASWYYGDRKRPYRVTDPFVLGSMQAQGQVKAQVRAARLLGARLP